MAKTICSVVDCDNNASCRGYCKKHYSRFQRTGDPLGLRRQPAKIRIYKGYQILVHKGVHVISAEKALGKPLPKGSVVHHADGDKLNNKNSNLVICPGAAYHNLLHARMRAMAATGNPNMRKCVLCKEWDMPANLYFPPSASAGKHKACDAKWQSAFATKKRARLKAIAESRYESGRPVPAPTQALLELTFGNYPLKALAALRGVKVDALRSGK